MVGCSIAGTLLVATPAAVAYKRIRSTECILRAQQPYFGGGHDYVVQGEVDCTGSHDLVASTIEVCAEVHNANGKWYKVTGSCQTNSETTEFNFDYKYVEGVNGHEYRTWDKAWLPEFGVGAEYESAGFTCGCP